MKEYLLILALGTCLFQGAVSTMDDFAEEEPDDLTLVTWAHGVNSKDLLAEALKGDKMMLEADIVMGTLEGGTGSKPVPIMAHPPKNTSDLSLKQFLTLVLESNTGKGIKLDFKSTEAFNNSVPILEEFLEKNGVTFPVWLNADILPGPVDCRTIPVDPDVFLTGAAHRFHHVTISVGWTTCYGNGINTGSYSSDDITKMTDALNQNSVLQRVTFAVRAGLAAQSRTELVSLIESSVPGTTLTIWSSQPNDYVDIPALRKLINEIGRDKVYLDVPQDMADKLLSEASGLSRPGPILAISLALLTFLIM